MRRQLVLLVLACSLFTGCYTRSGFPVVPLVVQLASPTGFRILQPGAEGAPSRSCLVRRAQIEVSALRGDTLHFDMIRDLEQMGSAQPCETGAGMIVLTDHPDLRSERSTLNGALSMAAVMLVALPLAVFFKSGLWWSGT